MSWENATHVCAQRNKSLFVENEDTEKSMISQKIYTSPFQKGYVI